MPLRPPEPGTFEQRLQDVQVEVSALVRLSRYPKTEPFWSHGRFRFDGPPQGEPGSFGTCYAADDLDVAFCESVIHGSAWFHDGHYYIAHADLVSRFIVSLQRPAKPTLFLADLTGKPLKALGLNNDISAGDDYRVSMAWASAIYASDPKWDGTRYVSRQHNDRLAVALFDRSGVQKHRSRKLSPKEIDQLADRFNIVVI